MSSASSPRRHHLRGLIGGAVRAAALGPMAAFLALVLMSTGSWTQGGVEIFENEDGGYSFAHPPSWDVTADGVVSKLVAPSQGVVISFGPGSSSSLRREATRSRKLIEKTYDAVTAGDPHEITIASGPALEITGTATNDAGVRVDFRVITLRAPERAYAIVTFAASGASVGEVSAIDGIVSSFQPPIEGVEPNAPEEPPAIGAGGAVRDAVEDGGSPVIPIAVGLGAVLVMAAWWTLRTRPPAHEAPGDQQEYVRVHLRDGRWIEGWRKGESLNQVIILDPVAACDREGLKKTPAPEDSFIPESSVIRIEPRAQRPA